MQEQHARIWRLGLLWELEIPRHEKAARAAKHYLPAHARFPFLQFHHARLERDLRIVIVECRQDPEGLLANRLGNALRRPPRRGANENVLSKAAGYFTSKLSKNEKAFFLDVLAKYRAGKFPLSTPLSMLKAWIIRFNQEYLMQQTFFEPYPESFMEPLNGGALNKEKDYWK